MESFMKQMSKNVIRSIAQTPLFSGFDAYAVSEILELLDAELLIHAKGDTITEIKEAESAKSMLTILSGMAQLIRYGIHGERYIIDYSFAGSVIGYAGSLSERYLFNSSYIAGRDSEVLRMRSPEAAVLPEGYFEKIEKNLLKIISNKYVRLLQKGDITTRCFVREKIMTYLSYESQLRGSTDFEIPLNRQELADYLCVDRTTLSTELTHLQNKGVLKKHKGHFVLLDQYIPEQ